MRDLCIYLPSGKEITPKILLEVFPKWFEPKVVNSMASQLPDEWKAWGLSDLEWRAFDSWAIKYASMLDTSKEWCYMLGLAGTARKQNLEMEALLAQFLNSPGTAQVIFKA